MSAEQPSTPEPSTPESSEHSLDAAANAPSDQIALDPESAEPSEPSPEDAAANAVSEPLEAGVELGKASETAVPSNPVAADRRSPPARRPRPSNDEILPQTLLRLLGEAVVAAQPLVKQQGIKALKGTIHLLEQAVERLEAEPTPKQVARRAPVPGTASENALPPFSQPRSGKLLPPLSTEVLQEKFQSLWQQLRRSWRGVLRQVRDRLPAPINRTWSDQALTGAIVGSFVLLLWATSTLLPDQPKPTTVAEAPPTEVVTTPPPSTPTPIPIPPVVKAPQAPKPVESSPPPVVPSPPPPPLKLTPEQTLIARIQNQVAAISNQYANGLVESIQANFRGSRLIVHISDGWYGLSRSQQDKLASEILSRTQNLDFLKLEMVDGSGKLLARSPVVGTEMIILRRTTEGYRPLNGD